MDQGIQQMMQLQAAQQQGQSPMFVGNMPGQQAMQPQGFPQNQVDVGQCGVGGIGYPAAGLNNCNQPALSQNLAPDCGVYQNCAFPVGVRFAVDAAGNVYPFGTTPQEAAAGAAFFPELQLFAQNGNRWVFGIQTFNGPGEVELTSVTSGDLEIDHIQTAVDAAAWNTTECYCYANWGCFSITNPLRIRARSLLAGSALAQFNATLWTVRQSAINSCGPIQTCGF